MRHTFSLVRLSSSLCEVRKGRCRTVNYLFHDNICDCGCGVDMPDILP